MAETAALKKREAGLVSSVRSRRRTIDDLAQRRTEVTRDRDRLKDLRAEGKVDPETGSIPSRARIAAKTVAAKTLLERLVYNERKLTRDEKKLDDVRDKLAATKLDQYQLWAKRVLRHPNTIFAFSSPTGGTARLAFEQQLAGKPITVAARNWPGNVSGKARWAWARDERRIPVEMCQFICEVADQGRFLVNCVANGEHRYDSDHYWLVALDGDKSSLAKALDWAWRNVKRFLGQALNEDRYHWHYWWERAKSLVRR